MNCGARGQADEAVQEVALHSLAAVCPRARRRGEEAVRVGRVEQLHPAERRPRDFQEMLVAPQSLVSDLTLKQSNLRKLRNDVLGLDWLTWEGEAFGRTDGQSFSLASLSVPVASAKMDQESDI